MATHSGTPGCSTVKIRRPRITTSGVHSDVDPLVKERLDNLNELLSKAVFVRGAKVAKKAGAAQQHVKDVIKLPLMPKNAENDGWGDDTLGDYLSSHDDDPRRYETLADYINGEADLNKLKYGFKNHVEAQKHTFPANVRTALVGYPAIADYLVVYGHYELELTSKATLIDVLLSSPKGVQIVIDYAAVSAARSRIHQSKLNVANLNQDNGRLMQALIKANLPLDARAFDKAADGFIHDWTFNKDQNSLIDIAIKDLGVENLPQRSRRELIHVIDHPPFPVTKDNVSSVVAQYMLQNTPTLPNGGAIDDDVAGGDGEFEVVYLEDDRELIQVSQSAVNCAAQLFYGMVLGDELDLFSVVNFFTHRYLVRGAIDITKHSLRNDLEAYVFNDKFSELDRNGRPTGRLLDRTRPAERQMFYRQVFNYGSGRVSEDVVVNMEFKRLWNVLMLESARYIERSQASPNPDSVSPTNVMQAVEDLQYNLSTSCTGMATVMTPLIYKELDFVVRRIFMNSEVMAKVAPGAGSWSRVVENLYMEMKKTRPKAAVLFNKAKLGHVIIQGIGSYTADTFANDATFSEFVSSVDAFITTQSILQQSLTDQIKKDDLDEDDQTGEGDEAPAQVNGSGRLPGSSANGYTNGRPNGHAYADGPSPQAAASGGDEWDF